MLKQITSFLLIITLKAQYTLNLNFPLLLDNSYTNISAVNQDFKNGFYVGFKDKQFRHYSSDFSTYQSYNFSYAIEYASCWWFTLSNIPLSNGSNWSSNSIMTAALTDKYLGLKVYNFTTMDQLSSYSLNQKVILYWGFPVQFYSSFIPNHVLICNQTIKVIHNGIVHNVLNFSQSYQPGVICDSAKFYWWYQNDGVDYYEFKYIFYVSLSNKDVLNLTVVLNFTMNYTSSTFDLSYNIMRSAIFTSPYRINKILMTNQLLLMQSNLTGMMYLYSIAALSMGIVDAAIPKNQIFSFFIKFNTFYVLQSYGLVQITYSSATNTISFVSVVSPLPYNTYGLAFGNNFDVLYVPNTPYVYKAGKCMNQTQLNGKNNCLQYNCVISNCYSCSFSSTVCSICHPGFTRNALYRCINSTTMNNSTINATNISNTTQNGNQSSVITQNSTSNNSSDSQNITLNGNQSSVITQNSTQSNSSDSYNDTQNRNQSSIITQNSTDVNSNNSAQQQNQSNSQIPIYVTDQNQDGLEFFFFFSFQWILELISLLLQILKTVISIPAARKIVTPLFYYFGNFDDLFLYSYHDRQYGDIMNNIFQQITAIQSSKWSLLSLNQICEAIGTNAEDIQHAFGFQKQYMSDLSSKQELNYIGFFENCRNFLFIEIPMVLLGVLILKWIFKALRNFSISQIFRKFDFWIYFFIIIFEGNVQQLSFYLTPELNMVFAFEWIHKHVKVLIILVSYSLLIFTVCGYFIGLSFYKKLNRYFTENNKNILLGNSILILQNGIRNMILGVTHSLFRNSHYSVLISILIITEGLFFTIFLLGISRKIYIQNKKIWIYILFTLLRVLLIIAFLVDRACINYVLFQKIETILIFQMIALYLLSIIFLLFQVLVSTLRFLCKMCKQDKKTSSQEFRNNKLTHQSYLCQNAHRLKNQPNILRVNSLDNNKQSKQKSEVFSIKIRKAIIFFKKSNLRK